MHAHYSGDLDWHHIHVSWSVGPTAVLLGLRKLRPSRGRPQRHGPRLRLLRAPYCGTPWS